MRSCAAAIASFVFVVPNRTYSSLFTAVVQYPWKMDEFDGNDAMSLLDFGLRHVSTCSSINQVGRVQAAQVAEALRSCALRVQGMCAVARDTGDAAKRRLPKRSKGIHSSP